MNKIPGYISLYIHIESYFPNTLSSPWEKSVTSENFKISLRLLYFQLRQ